MEAKSAHRWAVLEKELLQDHLGKKGGSSGITEVGQWGILHPGGLDSWRCGRRLS